MSVRRATQMPLFTAHAELVEPFERCGCVPSCFDKLSTNAL